MNHVRCLAKHFYEMPNFLLALFLCLVISLMWTTNFLYANEIENLQALEEFE